MTVGHAARQMLANEAQGLLTRIDRMAPFVLRTPTLPAAAIPLTAQVAIEQHLIARRRALRAMVTGYLRWLDTPEAAAAPLPRLQRRFSFLRLRFIAILSQLDIFADVINQRCEHDTGVWLSGLDLFAADALELPGKYYQAPPVICFLERGPGAAIRRARTRLPGGDENPVAVIQIPRERMIGSGIASSLVHEVGHQGAALLGLVESLQPQLKSAAAQAGPQQPAWACWERWISEVVADLWAVAKLGVSATVGLMAVVSLPRSFVFRVNLDDPHPAPWIRVKLSCAMGQALYPHPQWDRLARIWEAFYPLDGLDGERQQLFTLLEQNIPPFVRLLLDHRPRSLRGRSLREALTASDRQPAQLNALYRSWRSSPQLMRDAAPALTFAVIGQAKMDGTIGPEEESRWLADLLRYWALKVTLDMSSICTESLQMRRAIPS